MNHNDEYLRLLEDEKKRLELANAGNAAELTAMYDVEYELEDINAPAFWDARLLMNRDEAANNPMVQRRIRTVTELVAKHAPDANTALVLCAGYGLEFESVKHIPQVVAVDIGDVDCSAYPNIRFIKGDAAAFIATGLPRVDVVLLLEAIEHFQPKHGMKFLSDIAKCLNPGGRLVVSVPANEPLRSNSYPCPCCGKFINPSGHLRLYSTGSLQLEMAIAGYDPVDFVDLGFGYVAVGGRRCA